MRAHTAIALAIAAILPLEAHAAGATAGWNPRTFSDADAVAAVYQYKSTAGLKDALVVFTISSYDGTKWTPMPPVRVKQHDFPAGVLTNVETDVIPGLGAKAAGTKIKVDAYQLSGLSKIKGTEASSVIHKECKKAGGGKYGVVTCRWIQFQPPGIAGDDHIHGPKH